MIYVAVKLIYTAGNVIYAEIKHICVWIKSIHSAVNGTFIAIKRMYNALKSTVASGKLTQAEIKRMIVRTTCKCVAVNLLFFAVKYSFLSPVIVNYVQPSNIFVLLFHFLK
jgi:hypothetical protein